MVSGTDFQCYDLDVSVLLQHIVDEGCPDEARATRD